MAMNPGIPLPFKRYQIQPVWRADRPQKGRFREFYQCDVDIIGSESALAEAECLAVVYTALNELGFGNFTIRSMIGDCFVEWPLPSELWNKRPPWSSPSINSTRLDATAYPTRAESQGFSNEQVQQLFSMLDGEAIPEAQEIETALDRLIAQAQSLGRPGFIQIDPDLGTWFGLLHWTGFETVVHEPQSGSISGGGRYDELIGMFSGRSVPAVGVALGLERIIVVMEELGMLPASNSRTQVYVARFSEETDEATLEVASSVAFRWYPNTSGIENRENRQTTQNSRALNSWAVIVGPDEAAADKLPTQEPGIWRTMGADPFRGRQAYPLIRCLS